MLPVDINYFQLIANASLIVQFVLFLLMAFSVASWSIIIIKFRYLRKAFLESADFTEFFWRSRDLSGAFAKAKQYDISPVARVFRIGYLELKRVTRAGTPEKKEIPDDDTISSPISGSDNVQRALRRAGIPMIKEKFEEAGYTSSYTNTTAILEVEDGEVQFCFGESDLMVEFVRIEALDDRASIFTSELEFFPLDSDPDEILEWVVEQLPFHLVECRTKMQD